MSIYLDYQATTPLAPEARAAMAPWLDEKYANPHSSHKLGREAAAAIEVARDQITALLPKGGRLYFTSGATEALNWALRCAGDLYGGLAIAATEHAAVRDTAAWLTRSGRTLTDLPVNRDGVIDALPNLSSGTAMVAAMLVNNEIGVIQPISKLAEQAHRVGALFLCDAVQGFGRLPMPDGPDLIAVSAHKIHGPKGIGALWVREGVALEPLIHGGGQEGGLRSGTLSPALCAGFGAAAKIAAERMDEDAAHVRRLWDIAMDMLPQGWVLNGAADARYHGNLNIRRAGLDVARLISALRDIAFSAGSACASGSGRPSHVLRSLGLSDQEARSSVRIGFGRYTSEDDLRFALNQIFLAADQQGQAFQ
jgi:cysteine desulfurase